ncbi:MAG: sigma-54-dependent Fis family transcriptional regulator [Rhodocyclales bacterium]|nr:sigma-54-dependent Fis family transcriptional regulator [Rhodocyclales bacterium]
MLTQLQVRAGAGFLAPVSSLSKPVALCGRAKGSRRAPACTPRTRLPEAPMIDPFSGSGEAIRRLAEHARKVAGVDSPILLQGETGSGKGVLASWLHRHGPRAEQPFVDLNCAGLSWEFLDTELFGHAKGAFTGAVAEKPGLFEVAHRGTVFLDEIGDVDLRVQPKILKVLEEKRFRRMGEVRDCEVDIRLIAATHQDLFALVGEGKFREDLYFRISTIPLRVPPLRERREDIPLLARSLLEKLAQDTGRAGCRLSAAAERALQAHAWRGNIREMRNVLERAVLLCETSVIGSRDLHFDGPACGDGAASASRLTLAAVERQHIERVLREEKGRVEEAARRLGMPRSTLYQRLKAWGIAPSKI